LQQSPFYCSRYVGNRFPPYYLLATFQEDSTLLIRMMTPAASFANASHEEFLPVFKGARDSIRYFIAHDDTLAPAVVYSPRRGLRYVNYRLSCRNCEHPSIWMSLYGNVLRKMEDELREVADSLLSMATFMEIENWQCALATLGAVPPCGYERALREFMENEYPDDLYAGMCDEFTFETNAWVRASTEITSKQQARALLQMVGRDSLATVVTNEECEWYVWKLYCSDRRRVAVSVVTEGATQEDSLTSHLFIVGLQGENALVEHAETKRYASTLEARLGPGPALMKHLCDEGKLER